jgi:hypothetical protein
LIVTASLLSGNFAGDTGSNGGGTSGTGGGGGIANAGYKLRTLLIVLLGPPVCPEC